MALSFIKRVFTFGKDAPPQEEKDTPELTPAAPPAIEPEPVKPPQRVTTPSAPKFDDAPADLPPKV